jgi:cytidylate kinase
MKKITIAIDGYAACGKSTVAKALAKKLNYAYVDSGAMYRAVTLFFLRHAIDITNETAVADALKKITIHFEQLEGGNTTFLNNENVEQEIRTMHISQNVSPVSAIPAVRKKLVLIQRELGKEGGIVMDGRDIGTVVFKDAELKLFMTASMEVRSHRRLAELEAKGQVVSIEEIAENLAKRDHIDSTRSDSPLCMADDAVEIDNSLLTQDEQLGIVVELVEEIKNKLSTLQTC